jgi:hypothetical protein
MLIFLAFSFTFLHFFSTFVLMRKKLFDDLPKSLKLSSGIWLHIFPDSREGYRLANSSPWPGSAGQVVQR